jgi:PelA/Pel-15E family pectate lyase
MQLRFKIIILLRIVLLAVLTPAALTAIAQKKEKSGIEFKYIDTAVFRDAAHHWYDLFEKDRVIRPRPNQPRYAATELEGIADNILLYQKDNGGWPKNYDMQAILTPAQQDSLILARGDTNTTFDNRTTYSQIEALCKVYYVTNQDKYREASLKGLDFILSAQYANGGWPQYFPLQQNYSRCITYNDDACFGIMQLLKDILDNRPQYCFIDPVRKQRLETAFSKGLDCILQTQINDTGKPTAWCQQYNEVTLQPAWARKFEPPSICNGESVEIVLLLMSLNNPSPKVISAVENAVDWFRASEITGVRIKTIAAPDLVTPYRVSKTDKLVVSDPSAPPIWTRYYELKTHRPFFCNRDSKPVYSLAEVQRERRDGYSWYTYAPQKVLDRYPAWKKKWNTAKPGSQ